jgi:hypothetical protein
MNDKSFWLVYLTWNNIVVSIRDTSGRPRKRSDPNAFLELALRTKLRSHAYLHGSTMLILYLSKRFQTFPKELVQSDEQTVTKLLVDTIVT